MKKLLVLAPLLFLQLHANTAIDGKEYKETIPVTQANFTDAEAEVNFLK